MGRPLRFALLSLVLFLFSASNALSAEGESLQNPGKVPSLNWLRGKWMEASTLLSLPALNSTQGSAQCVHDILAIGKLDYPPITLAGTTGRLFIDGKPPSLQQTRWYAYQVSRKGCYKNLRIETAVRMLYEKRGILFHIEIKNIGKRPTTADLRIDLTAYTSRHNRWAWAVPRDADSASFSAVSMDGGKTLSLENSGSGLANCFSFEEKPNDLVVYEHSGTAVWHLNLKPGAAKLINYVLAIGGEGSEVHSLALKSAEHFERAFKSVETEWEQRWLAMFTPNNRYFSGHLPVLVTPDKDLRRMYYMSIASLLSVYRTCFPAAPRVYISNTPESNCTMMYFWDTREWATTLALLDPSMLKQYLVSWLSKGIYSGYAEEYLTGTLRGVWYSANDYSIFMLLNDYLNVTGDTAFLLQEINGKTVLEHMYSIATHWKSLVRPGQTLADYGKASNLLECVPTYVGEVASLNAANVWIMERTAEIERTMGNTKQADSLMSMADDLLPAVLNLRVPGKGYWYCIHDNGKHVAVRTVFDFATIGLTISKYLSSELRKEMLHFVETQLMTEHWMRALSWRDPAAPVSIRPDHGPIGAFCAWPAETMAVMCQFGKYREAMKVLNDCTGTTYEGPFSQSRQLLTKKYDSPVRITELGTGGAHSQTYNASNGGGFAETIIRGFFGYQPDFLTHTVVPVRKPRGFIGELIDVQYGNNTCNIISTKEGIKVEPGYKQ